MVCSVVLRKLSRNGGLDDDAARLRRFLGRMEKIAPLAAGHHR